MMRCHIVITFHRATKLYRIEAGSLALPIHSDHHIYLYKASLPALMPYPSMPCPLKYLSRSLLNAVTIPASTTIYVSSPMIPTNLCVKNMHLRYPLNLNLTISKHSTSPPEMGVSTLGHPRCQLSSVNMVSPLPLWMEPMSPLCPIVYL